MGTNASKDQQQIDGDVKGSEDILKQIEELAGKNNVGDAKEKIRQHLDKWRDVPVNLCVLGETGTGKSSFINNIDKRFGAKVDQVECTRKFQSYKHPDNPNLVFWDLPGFGGTISKNIEEYLQKINVRRYDLVLFLHKDRFKDDDAKLSVELMKIGKPFFIVRSRFDIDRQDVLPGNIDDLEKLKDKIRERLRSHGLSSDKYPCYFINNRSREYDYGILMSKIFDAVEDSTKRDVLAFSIQNTDRTIMELKRKQLEKRIRGIATLSAGVGAIPVPGLDVACCIVVLMNEGKFMAEVLGLTDVEECGSLLTATGITTLLKAAGIGLSLMAADDVAKIAVPIVGSIVSSTVAFIVTYNTLTTMLNKFVAAAETKMEMERIGAF